MQTVDFPTSLGTIPITGLPEAFSRSHPAVLAITGAFAPPLYMSQMPLLGETRWDGFLARHPGNETPVLAETSIAAFARAFDEVVEQLGRPVLVCGVSVGGVVALAMRRPRALLAIEPFLSTEGLWPVWPGLTPALDLPLQAEFVDSVFGFTKAGRGNRDYHHLVDELDRPTEVIVGDDPLSPRRPWTRMPSLVSDDDRQYLSSHPCVTVSVAPNCGHNVWWEAPRFVLDKLNEAVSRLD